MSTNTYTHKYYTPFKPCTYRLLHTLHVLVATDMSRLIKLAQLGIYYSTPYPYWCLCPYLMCSVFCL